MKPVRQRKDHSEQTHGGVQNANDQQLKAESGSRSGEEAGELQGMIFEEPSAGGYAARGCTVEGAQRNAMSNTEVM